MVCSQAHPPRCPPRGPSCRADFTQNKVGMEYEELSAAQHYVTSESSDNEPISSMKQSGEKCDLCACNPCQCGKMRKTGGTGNDPYEVRTADGCGWECAGTSATE